MNDPLRSLLLDELRDLYNAENDVLAALPRMAQVVVSVDLREEFQRQFRQTRKHVAMLDEIVAVLGQEAPEINCPGIVGVLQEAEGVMRDDFTGDGTDNDLIASVQRIQRFGMAVYGCVWRWAQELGERHAAGLLRTITTEKAETSARLAHLAAILNEKNGSSDGRQEEFASTTDQG